MEIYCWNGDWGLPSIDSDTIHALTYIKIAKAPVTVTYSRIPWMKKSVINFPMLKKETGGFLSGSQEIVKHLELKGFLIDSWLTVSQNTDVLALKALIRDKLYPCLIHYIWLDSRNFTEFSRAAYARKCIFPLNFMIPGRFYRKAEQYIQATKVPIEGDIDGVSEQLHLEAKECLNLLSSCLGEKDYFFGAKPTSFDALLFSYLAVLVNAPFANAKLQNHVKACNNLVNFVKRMLLRFFKDERKPEVENVDSGESKLEWVIPVGVATVAMFSYAVHIGLLSSVKS